MITGGCGFIGSRLALALIDAGDDVTALDVAAPPPDLRDRCAIVARDIRDPAALADAFDGADVVVHAAGLLSRDCDANADNGWATNLSGTMHVLDALARSRGANVRIIFLGTGGVYDANHAGALSEDARTKPRTLYAATKLAGEAMVDAAVRRTGATAVVLRLFTVYGPGPASGARGHFVASWLESIARRQPLIVHGSGEQTIDATHVCDVVQAIRLALRAGLPDGACRIFNIGSGHETEVVQIARWLRSVDNSVELCHVPIPTYVASRQLAAIDRARDELGYLPAIEPRAGLIAYARAVLAGDGIPIAS